MLLFRIYSGKQPAVPESWRRFKGPLLIAANHPNSFLDAIIVSSIFHQPVYALARGDVFKKKWIIRILHSLKILPVYRIREGADKLMDNYETFDNCIDIFRKNGVVLIFSEGLCVNEWHLRPLKKGTARLALQAWEQGIPLTILPLGINYSNFYKLSKYIDVKAGLPITVTSVSADASFGIRAGQFNKLLWNELEQLVYEIPAEQPLVHQQYFPQKKTLNQQALLLLPAALGVIVHAPVFLPALWFARSFFKGSDHYDSILTGFLFLFYPLYFILAATLLIMGCGVWYGLVLSALFPLTARAALNFTRS